MDRARRAEQIRRAKRAQRSRQRARGIRNVQLTLPGASAARLRVAMREEDFADELKRFLDGIVVRIADHPVLRDIAWNLELEYVTARHAFALYERNWRFAEGRLAPDERAFVDGLAARYGAGLIHA